MYYVSTLAILVTMATGLVESLGVVLGASAVSFSAAFPARQAVAALRQLRAQLLPGIALWAGGAALRGKRRPIDGVCQIDPLADVLAALAAWRAAQP